MRTWIEKQKYLIDFTLSCLARRKAKNLGLLLIYTLIVFLLASVMLHTHALRREAALVLATLARVDCPAHGGRSSRPDSVQLP